MKNKQVITVTSPSFSKHPILNKEIKALFPNAKLNTTGFRYKGQALIDYIKDTEGLILGMELISDSVLDHCKHLKIISKYGVGLNNIDLHACQRRNIQIGWTGGVNKLSVAEMTIGFMLMLSRNLFVTCNQLKRNIWNKSGGIQLSGKTIGIIGVGHIGKEVIRLLQPFNCKIFVNDVIEQDEYYRKNDLIAVTKEAIFREADFISVHTPLTELTENLINSNSIGLMKRNAFVINTARGGIVNEEDLKNALLNQRIEGAAIDTYLDEPPTDPKFLSIPNLICTPHIGGNANEAILAMGRSAIDHLKNYFL